MSKTKLVWGSRSVVEFLYLSVGFKQNTTRICIITCDIKHFYQWSEGHEVHFSQVWRWECWCGGERVDMLKGRAAIQGDLALLNDQGRQEPQKSEQGQMWSSALGKEELLAAYYIVSMILHPILDHQCENYIDKQELKDYMLSFLAAFYKSVLFILYIKVYWPWKKERRERICE